MDSIEFLNFNCIKCGKLISGSFFDFTEKVTIEKRYGYRKKRRLVKVPTCSECKKVFEDWTSKHSISRWSYWSLIKYYIVTLLFAIVPLFFIINEILSLISITISGIAWTIIVLGTVYIIYKNIIRKKPNSPFRYIKFIRNSIYFRPQGNGNWIKYEIWLERNAEVNLEKLESMAEQKKKKQYELEHDINVIYCPDCGAKFHKGIDFCKKCGKDLRNLEGNL